MCKVSRCLAFSRKWVGNHFYMAKWTLMYSRHMSCVMCHMSHVTWHHYSHTIRARNWHFETMFTTHCVSDVRYHMSPSRVTYHVSRAENQRGIPRLVKKNIYHISMMTIRSIINRASSQYLSFKAYLLFSWWLFCWAYINVHFDTTKVWPSLFSTS